jgi:hypothetical protein
MKRKRLLVLAAVALTAAVIVLAALEHHAYRQKVARGRFIDRDHCERIKDGLRQAEVEAILGGPPGDFRTTRALILEYGGNPAYRHELWIGNQGRVHVEFDAHSTVQRHYFEGVVFYLPPSLAERVSAWLRQLWP